MTQKVWMGSLELMSTTASVEAIITSKGVGETPEKFAIWEAENMVSLNLPVWMSNNSRLFHQSKSRSIHP